MSKRRDNRRVAMRSGVFNLAVFAILGGGMSQRAEAQTLPPDDDWQTLETEHFRVTFPSRLEALARRAGDRAERARVELEEEFLPFPVEMLDIVLTDHVDVSNGFAQLLPRSQITIFARPPVDGLGLGYFDDWLEHVITHELAHIVHLDRTGTWFGRLGRSVFGRVRSAWPLFPGVDTPSWIKEGIATWYESRLTNAGRVSGTFHEMILRTAALEGRFEDIGQAGGESPQWPGATRWYAYGSLFFDHLLEKYGEDRMAAFTEAIAGQWVPYRLDSAGRTAFGTSLSDEWALWADANRAAAAGLDASLSSVAPVSEPELLTDHARWAMHPTLSPDGASLVYARSDGRFDQQLYVTRADGSGGRKLTRTNGLSTFDWTPDGRIVFAQLEFDGPYRIFGDLYMIGLEGAPDRITEGARVSQPTVAPDGRTAIAVSQGEGTNRLVSVDLATGDVTEIVAPDPDVHWAFPSISPNGRWIAVTRWLPEANQDVVLLDRTGAMISQVTLDRALDLAPAWSADGRYLVWGSDRTGIPNLLSASVDPETGRTGAPRLVTNLRTGAAFPSIDPSGSWVYYSGYHVDGWEVERVPFRPESAPVAPSPDARFAPAAVTETRGSVASEVRGYSPLGSLLPTYWEPNLREPVRSRTVKRDGLFLRSREILGFGLGAQTSGVDLVGRHAYSVLARGFTRGGGAEGSASYSYGGLGDPLLGLFVSQGWSEGGALTASKDTGSPLDTLFILERERNLSGSVTVRRPTLRRSFSITVASGLVWEDRQLLDNALEPSTIYNLNRPKSRLSNLAVSLSMSTARARSFQMGGSAGASFFARARTRNQLSLPDSLTSVAGVDRSFDDIIGRVRAYLPFDGPGYGAHVLAVQGTFGVSRGPGADAGHFDVGGASGSRETVTGSELFGGDFRFFPVRGYDVSQRFGRYAWTVSAEYRVPLWLVNRGVSAWPIHFDRVVGSVFADAGNAWGPDRSPTGFENLRRAALTAVGAEITAQILTFYEVSMRFRTGVAVPLLAGAGTRVYLRLGMPF